MLEVETARESYPIYIGRGLASALSVAIGELRDSGSKMAIVTDVSARQALNAYFEGPFAGIPVIEVEPGERSKSIAQYERVLDFFAASGLDRSSVAIAAGGGVVGDLTGFAAASWLRGIRFIQFPTTLLSMVDSSVGGKTGINIPAGKNLVGAFHQPIAVYEDLDVLSSLPEREFAAGMAEVIKYGMLGDRELFEMLEREPLLDPRDERLAAVVRRNCQTKAEVVNEDEKEQKRSGGRALLNLGHTFGHAIENVAGYGDYLHGEAISIGFIAAAHLSQHCGYIGSEEISRIEKTLVNHGLPARLESPLEIDALVNAMWKDKKVRAGALRFVAMKEIGEAVTVDGIKVEDIIPIWRKVGAGD